MVKPWLDWAAESKTPVWLPVHHTWIGRIAILDPEATHDTISAHPEVDFVLSEAYYHGESWTMPLLKNFPNLHIEISRTINTDQISRIVDSVGDNRVLFGSRFPDASILPQLYWVERCGFSDSTLRKICAGNIERLLGLSV